MAHVMQYRDEEHRVFFLKEIVLDTTAKLYSKVGLNNLIPSLREKRDECTIPVKPVEQLLTRYKIKLGVIWASKH